MSYVTSASITINKGPIEAAGRGAPMEAEAGREARRSAARRQRAPLSYNNTVHATTIVWPPRCAVILKYFHALNTLDRFYRTRLFTRSVVS